MERLNHRASVSATVVAKETPIATPRRPVLRSAEGSRPEAFGPVEWALLAGVALIWGSSFVLIAESLEAFSPSLITFVRLFLGFVALLAFRRARAATIHREDWPQIGLLAVIWMAIPFSLFPIAQQWISSALTGMLNGAMPLFSALIAAFLLRRLPRPVQTWGLLIGFGGVVLLTVPSADSASSMLGIGLVLLAVAFYGLAVNLAVPLQQRYGGLPVMLRSLGIASVLTLPLALWTASETQWSWSSAVALAFLGVVGTGVAFVLMTDLVGRAGATRGSVATYFIPVVAVVLGVMLRGDIVTAVALLGVGLVLVGGYLVSRRERDSDPAT